MNDTEADGDAQTLWHVPREVEFESGGEILRGYLYVPPGARPVPCLVNNHGSNLRPGSSQVSRPQLAALSMSWGYAFFFPHRRGYGNSPGVPVTEAIAAPLGTAAYDDQIVRRLDEELEDVLAAVAAMRARPEIDGGRVAVSGGSRGGILSLLAAAADPQLRAAVNFCGGARQWANHPQLRRKMLAAAAAATMPVYLAQAENDLNISATLEVAAELERNGKEHECRIYPAWGASEKEGHLFDVLGAMIWGPDVRRFLDRCFA